MQPGTVAATVQGLSRPDRIFIKQNNQKKLKTLKIPHLTHPSTRPVSVWPAAQRIWSSYWVIAYAAFPLFDISFLAFLSHRAQNQKTQKNLKRLKIPSPSTLRLGNPHRARAWDSSRRGLGPRLEAHTGCDLDGFLFAVSIDFGSFGVLEFGRRTLTPAFLNQKNSKILFPFQPLTWQVICKHRGLQFGTTVARGSINKIEAHTGTEWGVLSLKINQNQRRANH